MTRAGEYQSPFKEVDLDNRQSGHRPGLAVLHQQTVDLCDEIRSSVTLVNQRRHR